MILSELDLVPLTHAWLAALFRASWQGAIAVGLVWCLCRWARRLPAWVRCWLWRLVLVKFLLVAFWPGSIDLPWLPAESLWSERSRPRVDQPSAPSAVATPGEITTSDNLASPAATTARSITLPSLFCVAWASGVVIVAVVLVVRARAARRWRKRCTLVKDAEILTLCEALAGELGVYQPPVLFVSDACESPVVFGALRTSVVLPARLLGRDDLSRLRLILRHEMAHIRRGDLVWNWVATAVWGLFFFHPLVWIALRELRLSQELACDACAVGSPSTSPADYASLLVELADHTRAPSNLLVTVGVVESFEFLKRRLEAMKDPGRRSRWAVPVSLSLLSLAIVGLLPWRLVAQAPGATPSATQGQDDRVARDGPDGLSPPLATILAGGFQIAIEAVRWAESPVSWVDSGFPVAANFVTEDPNRESLEPDPDDSEPAGSPNLVVDLRVSRPGDDRNQILCTVFGTVRASDDRGVTAGAPDSPAHLKMQLRGVNYPRRSGCTAAHMNLRDRNARSIKSLAGDLLIMELKVQQIVFEGQDLRPAAVHRLEEAVIRLNEIRSTPDGLVVEADILAPRSQDPLDPMFGLHSMRNRLRIAMEDSAANVHEFESASGGGGAAAAGGGAGSFASSGDGSSGQGSQSWSSERTSPAASYSFRFAPLPRGVTVQRIVCTVTDPLGLPQRVGFRFVDVPLP